VIISIIKYKIQLIMSTQKHITYINKDIFNELRNSINKRDNHNFSLQIKKILFNKKDNNITYRFGKY